MPAKVLDSFALIAYFRDESGAEAMEQLLVTASKRDSPLHMTDVNYAEVKHSIVKKDGAAAWAEADTSGRATTWQIPSRSRRSTKMTPPRSRRVAAQPMRVTDCPTCSSRSDPQ